MPIQKFSILLYEFLCFVRVERPFDLKLFGDRVVRLQTYGVKTYSLEFLVIKHIFHLYSPNHDLASAYR